MQMPEKDLAAFEKVVLAGMRIMYDKKTFEIFRRGMKKENVPLPRRLATEAAGLMKMLMDKSGNKIPPQIIAPAAAMLLMEMGKFATESGLAKPTPDDIRQATIMMLNLLKAMYGKKPAPGTQPPDAAQQPPAPEAQTPPGAPQQPPGPAPQQPPAAAQPQPATGLIGA